MKIGVVADDVTGANDIGIMFAKFNYLTHVYSYPVMKNSKMDSQPKPDVIITDTDSRYESPDTAYKKVYNATKHLQENGCTVFFNKTCSVFRGNIGSEFDAMLDALQEDFAVVVLGFPKNRRTTINGIHYVDGVRLEESPFRNDPIHPMTKSDLVEILQLQTQRKVLMVGHEIVEQGSDVLRDRIELMKSSCNYLILDVTDQQSLQIIAEAVRDQRVICGSSALVEELPNIWQMETSNGRNIHNLPPLNHLGVLCAAGSLTPQTIGQVQHMKGIGVPIFTLNTLYLFDSEERNHEINNLVASISHKLLQGKDVIFHSAHSSDIIRQTNELGKKHGLSNIEIAKLVSSAVSEIVEKIIKQTGLYRLVVAGGDTSAAICSKLEITAMEVYKEIQPGVPSCISLTEMPIILILKSGSFGSADFFEMAILHAKQA